MRRFDVFFGLKKTVDQTVETPLIWDFHRAHYDLIVMTVSCTSKSPLPLREPKDCRSSYITKSIWFDGYRGNDHRVSICEIGLLGIIVAVLTRTISSPAICLLNIVSTCWWERFTMGSEFTISNSSSALKNIQDSRSKNIYSTMYRYCAI